MIIPTPEFDPFFAHDGVAFRDKMLAYIQREFADVIGRDPQTAAAVATLQQQAEATGSLPPEQAAGEAAVAAERADHAGKLDQQRSRAA